MSIKKGILNLPDDPERTALLSAAEWETKDARVLHEWPLSRVEETAAAVRQRGSEGDARLIRCVVKSQAAEASAECAFYRRYGGYRFAEDGFFIPEALGIGSSPEVMPGTVPTDWLILPMLEGETEDWSSLTDAEIRARVRHVNAMFQIRDFEDAPVFTDWRTHGRFAEALEEDLPVFTEGGLTDAETEAARERIRGELRSCWEAPVGFLHGDLKGENLMRTDPADMPEHQAAGRIAVLDWQRPMRAPLPLEEELSLLLSDRGGSGEGGETAFRALACFSLAHWYALAFRRWIPYPFVGGMAAKYVRMGLE